MPRVAEGIVLPDGLKRSKGVARSHPGLLRGGGHRRAALGFANHIKQLTKVAVQSTLSSYKGVPEAAHQPCRQTPFPAPRYGTVTCGTVTSTDPTAAGTVDPRGGRNTNPPPAFRAFCNTTPATGCALLVTGCVNDPVNPPSAVENSNFKPAAPGVPVTLNTFVGDN